MFRRVFSCGGVLFLAGAVLFATPGLGWAAGGHSGGGHFGGGHFGGYHGGFYRGAYHYGYGGFHPYHYSYRSYYGSPPYAAAYGYHPSHNPYPYLWSGTGTDPGYDVSPSYPPPTTVTDPLDGRAHITVNVPPDAKVWFDGTLTTSTGAARQFHSPPLAPGSWYAYTIRARWNENGHEVTQTQRVEVAADGHLDVRFPAPPETTGQAKAG